MTMSDPVRCKLLMRGFSAVAAASLFALVQGCATQPAQSSSASSSSDYVQADSSSSDSASTDSMHDKHDADANKDRHHHMMNPYFRTATSTTEGSVAVEGNTIHYHAVAGLMIVHPESWNDAAGKGGDGDASHGKSQGHDAKSKPSPKASMFYVAYFKKGERPSDRPITFIYNGGPGSSTMWLHMGAFGPQRVVTADNGAHAGRALSSRQQRLQSARCAATWCSSTRPAPGFSRDRRARTRRRPSGASTRTRSLHQFIMQFLSKYGRWNSPKYLFGESYGTPRSAVLINKLETGDSVDFNGVILLSQILNFDAAASTRARINPGIDLVLQLRRCRPMRRPPGITTSCPNEPASRCSLSQARSSISR